MNSYFICIHSLQVLSTNNYIREYVKRCNSHIPLTPVYQLTPEEKKGFQEDQKRSELLDKLEYGEPIDEKELSQDEKFIIWKIKYGRKEV